MNYSTLLPPNNQHMSDDIVGIAVQHSRRPISRIHDSGVSLPSTQDSNKNILRESTPRKNHNLVRQSRWHNEKFAEIAELIQLGEKIKQEQRRIVQQRYRDKQLNLVNSLECGIQTLQDEIRVLEQQARNKAIEAAIQPAKDLWNVVVQYFNTFEHCLRLKNRSSTSAATQFDSLLNFVRATTTPDVLSSSGYGPEALIKSLSVLQWFDDVNMELEGIDKISESMVVATTTTNVTITEQMLRNVFPHLFHDEDAGSYRESMSSLTQKLCGQQIILRGSTGFVWDKESERIASVFFKSDMFTPMLRLLGNLEDVARVFENAILSPDFQWRQM